VTAPEVLLTVVTVVAVGLNLTVGTAVGVVACCVVYAAYWLSR